MGTCCRAGHRHGRVTVLLLATSLLGLCQLSATLNAFSFAAEPRSDMIPRRAVTALQPEITKIQPLPRDGLPGSNVVAITKPQEPWQPWLVAGWEGLDGGIAWIITLLTSPDDGFS